MTLPEDQFVSQLKILLAENKKLLDAMCMRLEQSQNAWVIGRDELAKIEFQLRALGVMTASVGETIEFIHREIEGDTP
jgi:hypothetical protein